MWRKMTIFKDGERRWRGTNIFWTTFMGGGLDVMIDFQNLKSRDLWYYFSNEMYGGDLDEMIDFQNVK